MFKSLEVNPNQIRRNFGKGGIVLEPMDSSFKKTERLFAHKIQLTDDIKKKLKTAKLPNTVDNFLVQSKTERDSPIGKYLRKIRYDSTGKPIKRTIVGTSDEFGRSKNQREERGFSLRRLRDEFLVKPRIVVQKK